MSTFGAMEPLLTSHQDSGDSVIAGEQMQNQDNGVVELASQAYEMMAVEILPPGTTALEPLAAAEAAINKSKRICGFPGCTRVIKSQNRCQKHGAKTKRCRVDGCDKQAQGTHDGMCKRHWKLINCPEELIVDQQPPPPQGESVYDTILPASIAFRPGNARSRPVIQESNAALNTDDTLWDSMDLVDAVAGTTERMALAAGAGAGAPSNLDPLPGTCVMPLIAYLQRERHREPGWHRNSERRARGMFLVSNLSQQLEPWERQLALVEILLLSGGTPYANFKDLAHAWGREKGFHTALVGSVCDRRGQIERKRRSDVGKVLSDEAKESFRKKLREKRSGGNGIDADCHAMDESIASVPQQGQAQNQDLTVSARQESDTQIGFGPAGSAVAL